MINIALVNCDLSREDEKSAWDFITSEFQEAGFNVTTNIREAACVILMFNPLTGITESFVDHLSDLVAANINPIYLSINAQEAGITEKMHADYREMLNFITPVEDGYPRNHVVFFYDNDDQVAYRIRIGNEEGISKLIQSVWFRV